MEEWIIESVGDGWCSEKERNMATRILKGEGEPHPPPPPHPASRAFPVPRKSIAEVVQDSREKIIRIVKRRLKES